MNTTSILIKTDPQVKKEAQETAKKMGLSLNAVVRGSLKNLLEGKRLLLRSCLVKKLIHLQTLSNSYLQHSQANYVFSG